MKKTYKYPTLNTIQWDVLDRLTSDSEQEEEFLPISEGIEGWDD